MIALLYGSVPVVTPTGGLKDTVVPIQSNHSLGNGFVAEAVEAKSFAKALRQAITLWRQRPEAWKDIMKRGMASHFNWDNVVDKYLDLYKLALEKKKQEESFN